jgi:hypothetical protein
MKRLGLILAALLGCLGWAGCRSGDAERPDALTGNYHFSTNRVEGRLERLQNPLLPIPLIQHDTVVQLRQQGRQLTVVYRSLQNEMVTNRHEMADSGIPERVVEGPEERETHRMYRSENGLVLETEVRRKGWASRLWPFGAKSFHRILLETFPLGRRGTPRS